MDIRAIQDQFPILKEKPYGKRLAYLDSGATTLKPKSVIKGVSDFYLKHTSNVHRGNFLFAQKTNHLVDETRSKVREFLNAKKNREIIFNFGTTQGLNTLARSLSQTLTKGDEVMISEMEHSSNIVPWQILKKEKGFTLRYIPVNDQGDLDLEYYKKYLSEKTKIVSVMYVSNVIGTVNPIEEMVRDAHKKGAIFISDVAQAVGHIPMDVQQLDVDFLIFSGHKLFAPSGVGVLYGKEDQLEKIPTLFGGGGNVYNVEKENLTYIPIPARLEYGTPPIESIIGLGRAIDFVKAISFDKIIQYEEGLSQKAEKALRSIEGIEVMCNPVKKVPTFSFTLEGVHPHDISTILNEEGVCIRAGKHCTHILIDRFNKKSTARVSFALYNDEKDIQQLVSAIAKVKEIML